MPTINNYTFSNVTHTIAENADIATAIGASFVTITISPINGYTATASDFSIDPGFSNAYVDSVTFAQSGDDVICTVNFVAGATMPSGNVTIPLCIIGAGEIELLILSGRITTTIGSNISGETPGTTIVTISEEGSVGEQIALISSDSYAASTGYYWPNSSFPSIVLEEGNESNYEIIKTPVYNSNNQLTGISFDVNYIFPSTSQLNNKIVINIPSTKQIYVPEEYVTSYGRFLTSINKAAQTQELVLYGGEGATFSVTLDDGTTVTPVVTNVDMPANGIYPIDIDFPAFTGLISPLQYEITISGDVSPSFAQPNPIIVNQYGILPRISFTGSSSNGITGFSTVSVDVDPDTTFEEPIIATLNWSLSYTGTSLVFDGPPSNESFDKYAYTLVECTATPTFNPYINVVSSAGVDVGDQFNLIYPPGADGYSPFTYEVTSVPGGTTIGVSPNITVQDGQFIEIYKSKGTIINIKSTNATQVTSTSIDLVMEVEILRAGNEDITFTLDIDSFMSVISSLTAYNITGSSYTTQTLACGASTFPDTVYVNNNNWSYNSIVYTDAALTTPMVGDGNWYKVDDTFAFSVKIGSNGTILDYLHLC